MVLKINEDRGQSESSNNIIHNPVLILKWASFFQCWKQELGYYKVIILIAMLHKLGLLYSPALISGRVRYV